MNQQGQGEQQLLRQMEVVAAQPVAGLDDLAPVDGAEGAPAGEPVQPVDSWQPFIDAAMPTVRGLILPQWELTDEECIAFASSLGQCLDMALPGAFNGKYACWANLALVSVGVTATRMMANGGKLPPLGPKRKTVKAEVSEASDTTAAQQTEVHA